MSFSIDVHLSIFNLIDIFFVSLLRTSKLSVYIHVHMFIFLLIDIFFVLSFVLHTSMFLSILICLYFNLNIARSHFFRITFYSFHFPVWYLNIYSMCISVYLSNPFICFSFSIPFHSVSYLLLFHFVWLIKRCICLTFFLPPNYLFHYFVCVPILKYSFRLITIFILLVASSSSTVIISWISLSVFFLNVAVMHVYRLFRHSNRIAFPGNQEIWRWRCKNGRNERKEIKTQ